MWVSFLGVVDNVAVVIHIGSSFYDKLVRVILPMERHIVPIQSHVVAIISKYSPAPDLLASLQIYSDDEINTEYLESNSNRTLLLRVAKCVDISPNT